MTMNGQAKPIAVDLGGAIFADGAGDFDVLAALPLAEGYAISFRNMDMREAEVGDEEPESCGRGERDGSGRHV